MNNRFSAVARNWNGVDPGQRDTDELLKALHEALNISDSWEISEQSNGVVIQSGYLPYSPVRAFRSTVEIDADPGQVAEVIADKAIEFLPQWNREFRDGEVLQVLENSRNRKSWIHRVRYRTPAPLKDREYLYFMVKETLKNGNFMIGYVSIKDHNLVPGKGALRSLLYPTVHLCESQDGKKTILKHILANNLRGAFLPFIQNHLLTRTMVKANMRDSFSQLNLFRKIKKQSMKNK
jgi:hypothetical protein